MNQLMSLKFKSYLHITSLHMITCVFVFLGPRPSAPGPITFINAGFDFLPVCVVKCSCATLIKHICEFSIHKY